MYLNLTLDLEVHRHFYLKVTSTLPRGNTRYRYKEAVRKSRNSEIKIALTTLADLHGQTYLR